LDTVAKSGAGAASGAGDAGAGAKSGAGTGAGTATGAGVGAGTATAAGVACALSLSAVCAAYPHEEAAARVSKTIPTAIAFRTDGTVTCLYSSMPRDPRRNSVAAMSSP
jgi:hypothetical protein